MIYYEINKGELESILSHPLVYEELEGLNIEPRASVCGNYHIIKSCHELPDEVRGFAWPMNKILASALCSSIKYTQDIY